MQIIKNKLKNLIIYLVDKVLEFPRIYKQFFVLTLDFNFFVISLLLSNYIFKNQISDTSYFTLNNFIISIIIFYIIFIYQGLYLTVFRTSGIFIFLKVLYSITIYLIIQVIFLFLFDSNTLSLQILLFHSVCIFLLISLSRIIAYLFLGKKYEKNNNNYNKIYLAIYGAGFSGRELYQSIKKIKKYNLVAFIDDSSQLQGKLIDNIEILSPEKIPYLKNKKNLSLILLAMPSISKVNRRKIINYISKFEVGIKSLPNIDEIIDSKVVLDTVNDLSLDEILGRSLINSEENLSYSDICDKVIMITGAGGSIGSELCKEIIKHSPKIIILVDFSEYNLYQISNFLRERIQSKVENSKIELIEILGSLTDKILLNQIFSKWNIDIIYHAAAYKHVPLVEYNIISSIKNNFFTTYSLATLCVEHQVSKLILISSDKAVKSTSMMGATKRLSEICLQSYFEYSKKNQSKCIFSMVRFGNVLESSGSVIPKFRNQIKNGGPITVTHKNVNRYFMSIKEAVNLVLKAGAIAEGGEVFVLDMGDPINIYELAKKLIIFSGYSYKKHNQDLKNGIEIEFIGLRPGEKLYEELFLGKNIVQTDHKKINKARESFPAWNELEIQIEKLKKSTNSFDIDESIKIVKEIYNEYEQLNEQVDYLKKKN